MELQWGCPGWVAAQWFSTPPCMLSLLLMLSLGTLEACSLLTLLLVSSPQLFGGFRSLTLMLASSHAVPLFVSCLCCLVFLPCMLVLWAWVAAAAALCTVYFCSVLKCPLCNYIIAISLLSCKITRLPCSELRISDPPTASAFASSDPV